MKGMKCNCGGTMKEDKVVFEGFIVGGFKCSECGNISFTPGQTEEILKLKEISKKTDTQRRIITLGHSLGMTIPKKLQRIGARVGVKAKIKVLGKDTVQINFEEEEEK
ncbi:hypothetical protein BEH94_11770 [Candidatus Altiarchaeales archaeon WOR_SM1_SCG]|nr:hypothetical protein BEH94_11770 [Candidatus Altiarchaeales archaeon WOR_SM1_SCG]